MFKLMILLTKKPTMSDDEFSQYFLGNHAPIAKKIPDLRKYVVNVVQRPPNKEPDYHGVAELWFDNREKMKRAFASPEGKLTQKDTENFAVRTMTLFIHEHTIT